MAKQAQYVYLIGSSESPLVKIGTTNNIASRLRSIQNMSPAALAVLWQTEGGLVLEQALHERFRKYRKHGEWFDFGRRDPVTVVNTAASELAHLACDPEPVLQPSAAVPDVSRAALVALRPPAMVSREFLLDDRISAFARGVGAYLLAWTGVFTVEQVANANGCSPDDVRAALDELADLDYVCIADGKLYFDGWPSPMEHADQHMPGYSEHEPEGLM
jgi:hypothetical protein